MEQTQSRRARFGPFELDLRAGELHGNGAPVLLPIQLLQVLRTLIERDGDLVSREELKKCLWPNDTTSYFDANLLLAQVSASAAGGEIVAVQNKETDRIELMTLDAGVASELKEVLSVHDTLAGFSWTPEGKILYARRNRMVVVDGNGSEENVFTSDPSMPVAWPDVCRDGKHVVFVWRFHDGTFSPAISRVDIDGSNPTQLTFGDDFTGPRCSPDSQKVAFLDMVSKQFTMSLNGGIPDNFMHEYSISGLSWSPDGKQVGLVTVVRQVDNSYQCKVVLYSFESHTKRYLPCNPGYSDDESMEFGPDGKSVAYGIREKRGDNIWLQPIDGSPGHTITNFPDDSISSFRFSPDGKHLALIHSHTVCGSTFPSAVEAAGMSRHSINSPKLYGTCEPNSSGRAFA